MISETVDLVRARLEGKGFPYPVVCGPERVTRASFQGAIVFERDLETGDKTQPPQGWRRVSADQAAPNASQSVVAYQRRIAISAMIYARSSQGGARADEHQTECDRVRDGVLCALCDVFANYFLEISEDRLISKEELSPDAFKDLETWPGAAARIRFSVLAPVRDVDYRGRGPRTGVVAHVTPPVVRDAIDDRFPDYDPDPSD